ncbi:MAG: hypothetical protein M1834_005173 [Cirrosporium novae-zelandiae]|nr:MAG: hypothetical protein M1834_005173 [Cirrosporium novae-zelandiae]
MALNLEKQLLFASNSPVILPTPDWLTIPNLALNVNTIGAFTYATLYVLMEPVAGFIVFPLIISCSAWMNHLTAAYGLTPTYWGLGIHIIAWIAQFVGHGAFEKRAPALLDNIVQALFLAPFFVWMHVLFALGYRPELQARLDKAVEKEIKKFHNNGKANPILNEGHGQTNKQETQFPELDM